MATLEQVEKLREKASVSFEEAKAALEACNDDLLDAIIWLEKQGKVNPPVAGGYYSSEHKGEGEREKESAHQETRQKQGESFSDMMKRFGRFCTKLIHKGNTNYFEVEKNGKIVISVPVTVLAISLIFFFWVVLPLLILGLFFGCRYRFRGYELGRGSVNRVMDTASDTAENIKRSFNSEK
ncbi:MAG: DUF4342 domain-containing protein [Clostridiales bacterium]|nr:DUF4342 domain-containing protein [Clostridiales bacterium]